MSAGVLDKNDTGRDNLEIGQNVFKEELGDM